MAYLIQLILLASIFIVPALSNGEHDKGFLKTCANHLERIANGSLQHLVVVVKRAVQEAEEDWPYVGLEVEDFEKYTKIRTYSNEKLAEPSEHGITGNDLLWNAKIVSLE
jgi:hypothetical protein